MDEAKKAFEWLEDEKFAKIAKDCPWNKVNSAPDAQYSIVCNKKQCAIWHFFKKLTE